MSLLDNLSDLAQSIIVGVLVWDFMKRKGWI
jgi:hypothetical protein